MSDDIDLDRLMRAMRWAGIEPGPYDSLEQAAKQVAQDYEALADWEMNRETAA